MRGPSVARVARARERREVLRELSPLRHHADGRELVSDLPGAKRAVLTLDPALQTRVASILREYQVPYAAVVALDPRTGRVLAYVSHSTANPAAGDLVLDATPPAASVFKVVTGAALVDRGVSPDTMVCYSGGFSRLSEADIADDPRRDRQCASLGDAMAGSINAIFAKLAVRHLDAATLDRYAAAFGFGQTLPFDLPTDPSPAEVPAAPLEFARTAAGFWHMHMSPLHGALIAATIANEGRMPRATIVDRVVDARGRVVYHSEPEIFRAVLSAATARAVGRMMVRTVSEGTARRAFHDPAGVPFLPGMAIAGKTGTLTGSSPYRGYTWWIGFAPAGAARPRIALAALVVNTPNWRIKASFVARETLRAYLSRPADGRPAADQTPSASRDTLTRARPAQAP